MARSRNIKPGFFKNELLAECSPMARLLFAGLWCLADRAGRLEDRPKRIRAEVMPYDDGSVDEMLNELHKADFIMRYQAGEHKFIQIQNFAKHQNPHHREPESTIPPPVEDGGSKTQASDKPEASSRLTQDKPRTSRADSLNLIPDTGFLIPESQPCSPSASVLPVDGFDIFWKQYPKKVARPAAIKAWKKLKPTGSLMDALMDGLQSQITSADWQKNNGQFIPHPATWLNGRRWEDEVKTSDSQAVPCGSLAAQDYTKGISDDGRF